MRIVAIDTTDSTTVTGLMVPIAFHRAATFGKVSAGSCASVRPNRSRTCVIRMMTAMPAVKPTVTG